MQRPYPKIVIVGGGMIGVSAAYYLKKQGAEVTLLEKLSIGDCIPDLSLTQVMAYCRAMHPGPLLECGKVLIEDLIRELGYSKSDERDGPLDISLKENEGGLKAVTLSTLARSIAHLFRAEGGVLIEASPAIELLEEGGCVLGVSTESGVICADETVVCAGLQSEMLLATVGLSAQLKATENRLGASAARRGIPGVFTGSVPLTPSGAPCVGRPDGLGGLYVAIGHDTNPVAAIAVGKIIAQALMVADYSSTIVSPLTCYPISSPIEHTPTIH